jgi:hypothetical protein
MKHFFTILCFLPHLMASAQFPEIQHVITHDRETVVTDPTTGVNHYPAWGVFPEKAASIRKMVMHLTLGSPDTLPTAHWDYLDHILIRRQGGAEGEDLNMEIGRMLTPYGSIYGNDWTWTWEVDVTDYAMFLRDSVEIEYRHSGYEPNTVGWALTLDFEIIFGPEVVKSLGYTPLWRGNFRYGDPAQPIEEALLPITYEVVPGSSISRIRIQHTGHGADRPRYCSEFCSRWREIRMDGMLVDHRDMWKECAGNPLFPQGGTWIFDRAYWCPGDLQTPDIFDVSVGPGSHTVGIAMEPYTATDNIQANESIQAFLFHCSGPLQKVDVAIDEVVVPTDKQQYSRLNPACFNPKVIIRNLGREDLRTLTLEYGTEGFEISTYKWQGNLPFNQATVVELPGAIEYTRGENLFTVSAKRPNGRKDAWRGDNQRTVSFTAPMVLPDNMILKFKTNDHPSDNTIFIVGAGGDTVYQRLPKGLEPNTLYADTLKLDPGQYELTLLDSAGDGLQFWFKPRQGDGYLRLFDMQNRLIHVFESDCGNGQFLAFNADPAYITDTTTAQYAFSMYPRLTDDKIELEVLASKPGRMTVEITVDGELQEQHEYIQVSEGVFTYHIGYLPAGRYVVEVFMDGESRFKGRVNKRRRRAD